MKILLVGNRAIQHALAVRLMDEGSNVDVYPGQEIGVYRAIDQQHASATAYDLLVLGSPRYLEDDCVNHHRRFGTPFFGVDRSAGQLEVSKEAFKSFARHYHIRTPEYVTFTEFRSACEYINVTNGPWVIKADGPAHGCGVEICTTAGDAINDLFRKLQDRNNAYYSGKVLIEEYVEGFEVGVNVLLEGDHFCVLPPTKPHKRLKDGDDGPNTAGMGSVTPLLLNDTFYAELSEHIIKPALRGIRDNGWYFRGCVFINLILTNDSIVVLEFNCRMGDPAMLVDLLLMGGNVGELLSSVTAATLTSSHKPSLESSDTAVAVTLVDPAYPEGARVTDQIVVDSRFLLSPGDRSGLVIAGAAADSSSNLLRVNNGVVASAVARASDLNGALEKAYELARTMPMLHIRGDIGRALAPPPKYEPL